MFLELLIALFVLGISAKPDEAKTAITDGEEKLIQTNIAILAELQTLNSRIQKIEYRVDDITKEGNEIDGITDKQDKRLVLDGEFNIADEVKMLANKVAEIEAMGVGSVYTRWGRKGCQANGTTLVYSGYAGGSLESSTGAAANYLCLSDDPQYNHVTAGHQHGADVFGAEYESSHDYSSAMFAKYFGNDVTNEDVPCAVCHSRRPSVLMIPGRMDCLAGWTKEYDGYLSAGNSAHAAASEFVCLDRNPEVLAGGHPNQNGKLFFLAEGRCGSLTCPPYIDGQELTCVVCTK